VILGHAPVEVKAKPGQANATAYISVLNTGHRPARVHVSFQASTSEAVKAKVSSRTMIERGKAARLAVTFTGLTKLKGGASGQLVVQGGSKPVAQSATIIRESPPPKPLVDWPPFIVGIAIGLAAVLMILVAVCVFGKNSSLLHGPAPGPKWSFDSWASKLTAVGALLGTVLGAATLPSGAQIDKASLIGLSLLFAGLTAASPFVFQALRSPKVAMSSEEDANWGYTWGLLIACWLTLGGVLGQLMTLGLASWLIVGGDVWSILLEIALGLLVILAAYYVVVTAYGLASADWEEIRKKIDAQVPTDRGKARKKLREQVSRRVARHVDFGPDPEAPRLSLRLP
jgi:hypothetical protein